MNIYKHLIVYKTIHTSGKYYIGRHCTNDLNDNYFGSGRWVKSIKNKSELTVEILDQTAKTISELKQLETKYINECFNDPLNMNWTKSSSGYDSEFASNLSSQRVNNGSHHFITNNPSKLKSINGTHHWTGGEYQKQVQEKRILNGTHNFLGGDLQREMAKKGTHPFLASNVQKLECPHCKQSFGKNNFNRWHGDLCKFNTP